MTSPFITVIIPVHNAHETLVQCVNSVLVQKMPDFEVILINDDSTDSSAEIMMSLKKKDERVYCYDTVNKGPGCARNLGLEKARGEWICCLDADDFLEEDFFARVKNVARHEVTHEITEQDKNHARLEEPAQKKMPDMDIDMDSATMPDLNCEDSGSQNHARLQICDGNDALMTNDANDARLENHARLEHNINDARLENQVDVILTSFSTYNEKCKCKFPAGWANRYTDVFKDDGLATFSWQDNPALFFETVQNIPWNKVVRKELLDEHNIKFLDTYVSEDLSYSIKACTLAKNIARLGEPYVVHREYTGKSAMDLKNEHPLDFLVALKDLKCWLAERGIFMDLREGFDRWTLNACLYNLTTHSDNSALEEQARAICSQYLDLFPQYHTEQRNIVFAGLTDDHRELADVLYGGDLNEEGLIYLAKDLRQLRREDARQNKQKMLSLLFKNSFLFDFANSMMKKRGRAN